MTCIVLYLEDYTFWNNNVNFSCQSTFEFFLVLLPHIVQNWQVRILWGSVATREPKRLLASFNSSMAHVLIIFSIYIGQSCFIWDPVQYLWCIYHNIRRSCCRTWLTQRMMSHLLRLRLIMLVFVFLVYAVNWWWRVESSHFYISHHSMYLQEDGSLPDRDQVHFWCLCFIISQFNAWSVTP